MRDKTESGERRRKKWRKMGELRKSYTVKDNLLDLRTLAEIPASSEKLQAVGELKFEIVFKKEGTHTKKKTGQE